MLNYACYAVLCCAAFMLVRLGFLVSLLATFPLQMAPFRCCCCRTAPRWKQRLHCVARCLHLDRQANRSHVLLCVAAGIRYSPCCSASSCRCGEEPHAGTCAWLVVLSRQPLGVAGGQTNSCCSLQSALSLLFQGPGLYLVTYLTLVGVYFSAAFITNIWQPLIILGSTAGAHS